ncbi:activase [Desulfosporosinus fructosivorans]|uniref:Activase n=2 Tax=Desulfosporosinus fructosivorans TaxID=2018669 RepID=A0A4Z0R3X7_9FIRM|nr:activase [Desulfosporosinus fructosivorans]
MNLDGDILGSSIVRSKIDPEETSNLAIAEAMKGIEGLNSTKDFAYLIGTGYGRNRVPFANENISEISCHAMGVHITDPTIKTIIDIGGQDLKGIALDENGSVKHFAMNDKCAAGTGRFLENMAATFEMSLPEFSQMSLKAKCAVPITSQCTVFAESEVISLVAQKKSPADIAAGIHVSVAKRCITMLKSAGIKREVTMSGGCAKNLGLKSALEKVLGFEIVALSTDPQLMGALGACEFARKKVLVAKASNQASR